MIFYRQLIILVLALASPLVSAECFHDVDNIFNQGKDYFERGQFLLSTQQFSLYSQLSCDSERQNKGRLRWAQSLFELGEIQEGNLVLDKISSTSREFEKSKILRAWYQPSLVPTLTDIERRRFQDWTEQTNRFHTVKKPWLAGTLSAVLPGLGQVYNGNYQSALFSFVLNALFLSSTIELHNKNMDATAVASGVIFSVVYVGNIVGSAQSSEAINRNAQEPAKSELKTKLFPELSF